MACICEVCGKGEMAGSNVSHSNRHTKRSWKPNINLIVIVKNETKYHVVLVSFFYAHKGFWYDILFSNYNSFFG